MQLQDNPVSVRKKLKLSFWNFSAHNSVVAGNFHVSNQALIFIDKVFTVVFLVGALFVGSDQYQYSGSYWYNKNESQNCKLKFGSKP